jgi:hypothetical protein
MFKTIIIKFEKHFKKRYKSSFDELRWRRKAYSKGYKAYGSRAEFRFHKKLRVNGQIEGIG